jgi:hypothetical protein
LHGGEARERARAQRKSLQPHEKKEWIVLSSIFHDKTTTEKKSERARENNEKSNGIIELIASLNKQVTGQSSRKSTSIRNIWASQQETRRASQFLMSKSCR